jgi:ribosomal protein S18 acetylase RimI-like enzyme
MISPASLPSHLLRPNSRPLPGLTFRLAQEGDLHALHRNCYPHVTARDFARQYERSLKRQASGRGYHLVALLKAAGEEALPAGAEEPLESTLLVGSGQLILHPHSAELAELSVPPAYRSRGIGTALIKVLIGIARHLDLSSLEIGVMPENTRALSLYQRLGFVADRHLRVALAPEPALILVKDLGAADPKDRLE